MNRLLILIVAFMPFWATADDSSAFQECIQSVGGTQGQSPTDAQRKAVDACMKAKGAKIPAPPNGGPQGQGGGR